MKEGKKEIEKFNKKEKIIFNGERMREKKGHHLSYSDYSYGTNATNKI